MEIGCTITAINANNKEITIATPALTNNVAQQSTALRTIDANTVGTYGQGTISFPNLPTDVSTGDHLDLSKSKLSYAGGMDT